MVCVEVNIIPAGLYGRVIYNNVNDCLRFKLWINLYPVSGILINFAAKPKQYVA